MNVAERSLIYAGLPEPHIREEVSIIEFLTYDLLVYHEPSSRLDDVEMFLIPVIGDAFAVALCFIDVAGRL